MGTEYPILAVWLPNIVFAVTGFFSTNWSLRWMNASIKGLLNAYFIVLIWGIQTANFGFVDQFLLHRIGFLNRTLIASVGVAGIISYLRKKVF